MQAAMRTATMMATAVPLRAAAATGTARSGPALSFLAAQQRLRTAVAVQAATRSTAAFHTGRAASVRCSAAAEGEVATEDSAAEPLPTASIEIRIGKILKAEVHPDAESLFVETIDVGEEEPRTIISGLAKYVPLDSLQDRMVVVLCNLKPRNMRGIKSFGMLLCASDEAHENVEPLLPPEGAVVGERVFFGEGGENQPEPDTANKVQKKKLWEGVQPDLKTDESLVASYKGITMLTSAGPVKAPTLAKANIS
mmetsp:Transcript_410/g.1054  ORF Transcript_410/g.1054 Transcript_410/m.1054 type:complete len:253 (-) Transcript_410:377-1135(-)